VSAPNRAGRRAAAKSAGVSGQLYSALVLIDELGDRPSDAIAVAVVQGLGMLIEQGADPLDRCAITLGTDHPEHLGKIVLELKTDRRAPSAVTKLGKPITLGELRAMSTPEALEALKATEERAPMYGGLDEDGL
jgi:hypothetical protein